MGFNSAFKGLIPHPLMASVHITNFQLVLCCRRRGTLRLWVR